MFDNVMRVLDTLKDGLSILVEATTDDDGYFDRICSSSECRFAFKVLLADWKTKVKDDKAFCPFCRHAAGAGEFNTPEQQTYFDAAASAELKRQLDRGFHADAQRFNRSQTGSFVTLQLKYRAPQVRMPVPPAAEEAMTLRIVCEQCICHFAVIGAGYFCPACGCNSAGEIFNQSVDRACNTINMLPVIKAAIVDRDAAAQVAQNLIEGTFGNLVTAFQHFAEAMYPKLRTPSAKPRRNAFQNLAEGSQLWHSAGGREYSAMLDIAEMADLVRLFQQRHVLQHCQGIVDRDYIARSGDTMYSAGQRLIVREQAVLRFADLVSKLTDGMRADIA